MKQHQRTRTEKPDGRNVRTKVLEIFDEEGNLTDSAPHPKQRLYVRLDAPAEVYDILRKRARDKE